jgi:hypothetical protein
LGGKVKYIKLWSSAFVAFAGFLWAVNGHPWGWVIGIVSMAALCAVAVAPDANYLEQHGAVITEVPLDMDPLPSAAEINPKFPKIREEETL